MKVYWYCDLAHHVLFLRSSDVWKEVIRFHVYHTRVLLPFRFIFIEWKAALLVSVYRVLITNYITAFFPILNCNIFYEEFPKFLFTRKHFWLVCQSWCLVLFQVLYTLFELKCALLVCWIIFHFQFWCIFISKVVSILCLNLLWRVVGLHFLLAASITHKVKFCLANK